MMKKPQKILNRLLAKFGFVLVKKFDLDHIHDEAEICREYIHNRYMTIENPSKEIAGCVYRAPQYIIDQCLEYECYGTQDNEI